MPAANSFEFRKGEDVDVDFVIRESDSATAAVRDITGWTFSFKVKRRDSDADPSVVTPTITVTDAVNGAVKVVIASADLDAMFGDYRHAFWRTNTGAKSCLSEGLFSVVDTVES